MKNTAIEIVKILQEAGHTAYWAGGCVRDLLMSKYPKDYDIATSASPDEIENLFEKTFPIGKSFGVVFLEMQGHHFEIATFRNDGSYSDGRRPDAVIFSHPAEDALRRDFTINGLFFDPIYEEIHDFVGGQDDIKNKIIRFIGDPSQRIKEDHLRILRAVRFKNVLNFSYDSKTYDALQKHSSLVTHLSMERVREEMNKILDSEFFISGFKDLFEVGIIPKLFPEFSAKDSWQILESYFKKLDPSVELIIKWTILIYVAGADESLMRKFRFPRRDIDHAIWILKNHKKLKSKLSLGEQRMIFLDFRFPFLFEFLKAVEFDDLNFYKEITLEYQRTLNHFSKMPKPFLTGKDLISEFGMKQGSEFGKILSKAFEAQLNLEFQDKSGALDWIKRALHNRGEGAKKR